MSSATPPDVAVSVVMPAHNEEHYLAEAVHAVATGLHERGRGFEIIVVENGSTDRTIDEARRLGAEVPELRLETLLRADYGRALRTGLLGARADVVVSFDVDYYDLGFLESALGLMVRSPDLAIVVGSKRAEGANDTRSWPRRLVTWGFSTLLRLGFGMRVSDTHGMKAMARDAAVPVARECRFDADLFDTELVIRAERRGLRVAELPVTVEERRPSRTSIARRVLRSVGGLVRLRISLWREHDTRR